MKFFTFVCTALVALSLQTSVAFAHGKHAVSTVVETEYGSVQGVEVEGFDVIAWKGLPYAKPPLGELRWRAPQNPDSWEGIRDASAYGSRCFQPRGWGGYQGAEDCLYLNVWAPTGDGDIGGKSKKSKKNKQDYKGKLPVFFYIHGGSNTGGSGEASWYTVAQNYNAVVVSINYRVGALGWFSHPALKTGNPLDDSGNFGTLDQIMALQWVQDNIEKFGGDHDNVTIVGASAGAQNVSYLMHSQLAKDLFHKAIMESNYPGIRPVEAATKSSKQVLYNLLVADPGNAISDSAAAKTAADAMAAEDIRDYFYASTPEQIYDTYFNWYWGPINWGDFYRSDIVSDNSWAPPPIVQIINDRPEFVYSIGDGYVLPNDIDFADFSKGHVYPRPIVVGTTLNENNAWNAYWPFNFSGDTPLADLIDAAINGGDPYLMGFGSTPAEFMANYKFATELIDELDMYLGAQLAARNLAQAKPGLPIYVYRFDWGASPDQNYMIPEEDAWKFYVGAPHTQEYDFFWQRFGALAPGDSVGAYEYTEANLPGRQDLSASALSYLAEFIHDKKGRIRNNSDQPAEWKQWDRKKEQFIVFDGDYQQAQVAMNSTDIYRTPEQLYAAYLSQPNEFVRDFIAYYVMWSWHYNWYPNAEVGPFDTSPGVNPVFDPLDP